MQIYWSSRKFEKRLVRSRIMEKEPNINILAKTLKP